MYGYIETSLSELLFIPKPSHIAPVRPPVTPTRVTAEVKAGDILEITITTDSFRKYWLLYIPKKRRRFFPGFKIPFVLETDISKIETRVTSGREGTPVGDPDAGAYIGRDTGLRKWYERHPQVTVGTKVRFECLEPYKRYRLI